MGLEGIGGPTRAGGQMAQLGTKAAWSSLESTVRAWTDRVGSGSVLLGLEWGRMACVRGGGAFLPPSQ